MITLSLWYISKPVSSFPYHHNPSYRYWNQNILVIVAYVLFGNQFIGVGFYCCPNKCSLFVSQNSLILNIGYCILAPNIGVGAVHKTGKAQQIALRKKKKKSIIFAYENLEVFLSNSQSELHWFILIEYMGYMVLFCFYSFCWVTLG